MILGSFGEPVGAKLDLGVSCGTHGLPKWFPESPKGAILVDFEVILGHLGVILGLLGCQIGAKSRS